MSAFEAQSSCGERKKRECPKGHPTCPWFEILSTMHTRSELPGRPARGSIFPRKSSCGSLRVSAVVTTDGGLHHVTFKDDSPRIALYCGKVCLRFRLLRRVSPLLHFWDLTERPRDVCCRAQGDHYESREWLVALGRQHKPPVIGC